MNPIIFNSSRCNGYPVVTPTYTGPSCTGSPEGSNSETVYNQVFKGYRLSIGNSPNDPKIYESCLRDLGNQLVAVQNRPPLAILVRERANWVHHQASENGLLPEAESIDRLFRSIQSYSDKMENYWRQPPLYVTPPLYVAPPPYRSPEDLPQRSCVSQISTDGSYPSETTPPDLGFATHSPFENQRTKRTGTLINMILTYAHQGEYEKCYEAYLTAIIENTASDKTFGACMRALENHMIKCRDTHNFYEAFKILLRAKAVRVQAKAHNPFYRDDSFIRGHYYSIVSIYRDWED